MPTVYDGLFPNGTLLTRPARPQPARNEPRVRRRAPVRLLRAALIAAVVACAFNAVLRTVVRVVAHVPDAFDPFTWPPILVATCAGVAAGTIVFLVLRRFLGPRTNVVFKRVGYCALALSSITPLTLLWTIPPQYPGTSWLTVGALELMHVSTAVATISFIASSNAIED